MTTIIPHWLSKQAYLSPNKRAITVHNGKSLTFLQLKNKSKLFARKLASFNIKKETKVALLSPNCLEMVIAIHALSYLQCTVVLLNNRLTEKELNAQLEDANIEFIIIHKQNKHKKLMAKQILTYDMIDEKEADTTDQLAEEINLSAPFTMMYTSGTTGFPKGVIHTYGNHWWSAIGSLLNLGFSEKDKWLAALPIFHVSGLSILFRSFVYCMTGYLLDKSYVLSIQ